MAVARTQTFDQRAEILGSLVVRNRLVGLLRIIVPASGAAALLLLVGQIWFADFTRQYGVSGIRIDRGNLVVETPQYSEMGIDGTRYVVAARDARTPLTSPGEIEMANPKLTFVRPGRPAMHAAAAQGTINTGRHVLTAPGITSVAGDDGLHGTLTELRSDMKAQVTTAEGPVDLFMADGSHLVADNMRFEAAKSLWTFKQATLTVPRLPIRTVSWMNVFAIFAMTEDGR